MDATSSKFKRLGKSEIGRYAFEERMPEKIFEIVSKEDDSNDLFGVIPALTELLEISNDIEVAYLCNQEAVQIATIPNEGCHFCGYRNIQMLLLSLDPESRLKISSKKLAIPEIQDMIEKAWDADINAHGRVQTGGIKGTRKHIGTSEAEAILLLHSIPCTGYAFQGPAAWSQLLVYVEAYFAPFTSSTESKIRQTNLSPIFLQRPHHSLTIVGFERTKSGQRRLLVFDPAWRPRRLMEPRSATLCSRWIAYWTLNSYSKGERYLKRFKAFETLAIDRPVLEKHSN